MPSFDCFSYLHFQFSQEQLPWREGSRFIEREKNYRVATKNIKSMYDECVMLSMRFPQKLWKIVNDCKTGAIRWSSNGGTILLDYKKFQDEYLSAKNPIFKTSNITSFIRQLNLYGFRKVTSHNRDPVCNSNNPDIHEFLHVNFHSGRSELLAKVCRKSGNNNRTRNHERVNCVKRISTATTSKKYEPTEVKMHRMTRLQVCQYALTRALEQAIRDYRREKMVAKVLKHEAMMELANLESEASAVWARRYKFTPLMRNS